MRGASLAEEDPLTAVHPPLEAYYRASDLAPVSNILMKFKLRRSASRFHPASGATREVRLIRGRRGSLRLALHSQRDSNGRLDEFSLRQ
jgi:hypothetical protein